ncbi:PglZ domain-containing protein [Mesonia sp.]|uniref:PglZ domain-containing protein n=1 Tax=Mesonia sp. TaxID=1960830 RepID=UPI003F9C939E
MGNSLVKEIVRNLKSYGSPILILENNDGFLFRDDVIDALESRGFKVSVGSNLFQRIDFETIENAQTLLFLNRNNRDYLEDIEQQAYRKEFFLSHFMNAYHIPSIKELDLNDLEKLYAKNQIHSLSKKETKKEIDMLKMHKTNVNSAFDYDTLKTSLENALQNNKTDWKFIAELCAEAITGTTGTDDFDKVWKDISAVNTDFQTHLAKNYQQLKNSNAVKKPKIVSKVLDYIHFNFKNDKVVLLVVDGLSYWQFSLFKDSLPGKLNNDIVYSWIPSITQLSRQALFRGDTPFDSYRQNPTNEAKLWKAYWKDKGFEEYALKYQHGEAKLSNLSSIERLAIVYNDLDEYIHSSNDYHDLLKLTENWVKRVDLNKTVAKLLAEGFKIFMTTDHGNIQARGWRTLRGREKLGTNKSGSRSARHIEYAEPWLQEELINNNPELVDSVVMEDNAIYFKNDLSFSSKPELVSHGGAHFLEVIIPFIEISNG